MPATTTIPRLVPGRSFPSYSYVPGRSPHPISDPEGHSFDHRCPPPPPIDPEHWSASEEYLYGIDLFNHGFYWEAHEVWEGLWLAAGRAGVVADFMKGLIQLTAAGVKVRQGMPTGVVSLASGAADLFQRVLAVYPRFLGLDVRELLLFAQDVATRPETWRSTEDAQVERIFPLVLRPTKEGR